MGGFDQDGFNRFVLDNGVVGFFKEPIKLKSGRRTYWYVNWRNVAEDVFLADQLTDYVIAFTRDLGLSPDCFYGVPEGATKLGVLTQYKWAKSSSDYAPRSHILPMGRGRPKDHGAAKDRLFLGQPRGKTIVLEDVTTTGESLMNSIETLKDAGADVVAAFGVTNRMELRDDGRTVQEAVESMGVQYHALSNALHLLPEACRRNDPGEKAIKAIEEEFDRYGIGKIVLK
ncbi:MAG: hypothetical protein GF416_08290 [Candidatus Altiarchaeales archaeon]|nr:hypothetical protein [Candidatus Altiarchaeales archaeon]MBD3417114.1 hypothetical protein [Candidatus Altiarchaeales archaeon]